MGQLAIPAVIAAQVGSTALGIGGTLREGAAQVEQQRAANAQDALALEERRLRRMEALRERLALQRAQFGATGRAGTDPTLGALQTGAIHKAQRTSRVGTV